MLSESNWNVGADFREKEKTVAILCHIISDIPPTREKVQPKMKLSLKQLIATIGEHRNDYRRNRYGCVP